MNIFVSIALSFLYWAAIFSFVPVFGPFVLSWIMSSLSILFLWIHHRFVNGQIAVPLIVVFFTTFFLPVAVLFAIGFPVYHSWDKTASSLLTAFQEYGRFWGLELLLPFFVSVVGAIILRHRSNSQNQIT